MEARRDSIASIREGSTSPEAADVALPLLLRDTAAACVGGVGTRTKTCDACNASSNGSASSEGGIGTHSLDALTERVVAATPPPGRFVVLVMGARGKLRPADAIAGAAVRSSWNKATAVGSANGTSSGDCTTSRSRLSELAGTAFGNVAVER